MIDVMIVHPAKMICSIMTAVLQEAEDIHVRSCASSISEAMGALEETSANIVLVDDSLPDNGACQLTEKLQEEKPSIKVLVTGTQKTPASILQYVEAGADGFVLQEVTVEDLLAHIRAADKGEALIPPEIGGELLARLSHLSQLCLEQESLLEEIEQLTPREKEVLVLLSQGLQNKEIAEKLTIEVGTVKNHVHSILKKLDVDNRGEAAEIYERTAAREEIEIKE